MMRFLKGFLNIIVCKILFRVKFENTKIRDNIGRCVVVSNHIHFYDPVMLYSNIPELAVMAKKELFENKILNKIFTSVGMFPIDRGKKDIRSLKHALKVLENEKYNKLLIYPEGTRVEDGVRVQGKIGAVYIAMKAKVPILPISINMQKRKYFSKVIVTYHDPIYLDYDKIKDREYMQKMTDGILDNIYNYMK